MHLNDQLPPIVSILYKKSRAIQDLLKHSKIEQHKEIEQILDLNQKWSAIQFKKIRYSFVKITLSDLITTFESMPIS